MSQVTPKAPPPGRPSGSGSEGSRKADGRAVWQRGVMRGVRVPNSSHMGGTWLLEHTITAAIGVGAGQWGLPRSRLAVKSRGHPTPWEHRDVCGGRTQALCLLDGLGRVWALKLLQPQRPQPGLGSRLGRRRPYQGQQDDSEDPDNRLWTDSKGQLAERSERNVHKTTTKVGGVQHSERLFFGTSKSLWTVTTITKLKDSWSLEEKLWPT